MLGAYPSSPSDAPIVKCMSVVESHTLILSRTYETRRSFPEKDRMVSCGAAWTTGAALRWFVRVAAVLVGLANSVGVILWLVGAFTPLRVRARRWGRHS